MTGSGGLRGKRVTVVGLGIEGVALTRYLTAQGASVTVTDAKPAASLTERLAQIEGLPVTLSLGANRPEDCAEADLVFVSQGVPLDLPALQAARERHTPLGSATQLFMERCRAPIAGVTGSAGKTTTTSLLGAMFEAAGQRVHVGGNIGVVLLDRLDTITSEDWVVLEMSHTQLELTNRSPHIALVTNISPSHADHYPAMDDYIALKRRIYEFQCSQDFLVLNWDDPVTREMAATAVAKPVFFSTAASLPGDAAFVAEGRLVVRWQGATQDVIPVESIPLMGAHNRANVLAACAAATATGIPFEAQRRAVEGFRGVEHRLEWVRALNQVDYYNDSIATTPERTIAGLRCFNRPIVLLAGGREKHLPLDGWASEVAARCRAVVCFGEAGPMLQRALEQNAGAPDHVYQAELPEAVAAAARLAYPGDIVLLSPACTSFDRYPNFEARGRHFKALVNDLTEELHPRRRKS
ncbi:MAG: UDP-N-acetylmuramoyl-L-alanine--D-glutamate ligase [Dehalococcoidia bacterium]|nr:UDP-N-acetylmuramoyl-L-alanine--D-glutamate ligase [Dehalococcoidia bacterium]